MAVYKVNVLNKKYYLWREIQKKGRKKYLSLMAKV